MKSNNRFIKKEWASLKIAIIYAVFSTLWILLSDQILFFFIKNPEIITKIQTMKGWVFVLISALVIYIFLQNEIKKYIQTEIDLIESQKKLKAIFNHRFQLTGLLDNNGKLLMANESVCNMVKTDCDDITGEYIWNLPHWSHSKEEQLKIKNAVQEAIKGAPVNFETTHLGIEGKLHHIEFSLTPVHNDNGDIIYIVPEGKDITEKKQSEKKLIESERNYREIYNSGSDAIIIHDAENGKILDVNQTMLDMYGYTHDEALDLEICDISSNKNGYTQDAALKKLKKTTDTGPQLIEWMAKHKGGNCFWVEVALQKTKIGGKGRVMAVVRDIRQRKSQDKELYLKNHSIEYNAYPFEWIKEDGHFFYVNKAACDSLGYTREELCSMCVSDIDPDFTIDRWPGFWKKLKAARTLTFETRHRNKKREIFPVEITANHIEFEGQEHVFANIKDISDRILYESKQKTLERQLQQAQKMEAIGTLAGGIAHDFNNILSAILGYGELLQEELKDDSSAYEKQEKIMEAGFRARDLVQQILLFSRQADQEIQPVQPHLLVQEALKLLKASIPATIEIKENIPSNCGRVLADPTQIHQIIMNLCTNAYHAMKEKGGTLEISLSKVDITEDEFSLGDFEFDIGRYLKLEISDTGHGMDSATIEEIFNPYFTTKLKGEGTGLGLSVVHGIVKNMRGSIKVNSQPEKGTTFEIYIPSIDSNYDNTKKTKKPILPKGTEHICIVDDERQIIDMMQLLLKNLGYAVTPFTSGTNAFEAFKSDPQKFDLIITDYTMPKMSGVQLSEKIISLQPDFPIILCSGFSELLDNKKVKRLGIKEFLTKPVLRSDLAYAIRNALQ